MRRQALAKVAFIALGIIICIAPLTPVTSSAGTINVLGEYVFPEVRHIIDQGISDFEERTQRKAHFQLAFSMDEAIVRAVVMNDPVDVMVIGHEDFVNYKSGDVLLSLDEFAKQDHKRLQTELPQGASIWGRVDGDLYCLYLSGRHPNSGANPNSAFVCVSRLTQDPSLAWDLALSILLASNTADSNEDAVDNFFRKLLFEQDFRTLYHHFLHPDRRQEGSADSNYWTEERFIAYMTEYVRRLQPIFRARRVGPQPRLAPGKTLTYVGDPSQQASYDPKEVVAFWYQIDSGEQHSIYVRLLDAAVIAVSLHVQTGEKYPTRYIFHSPDWGFEQFWFSNR